MQDPRLILFDIDGTLIHSGGCGRAATRLAVREVFGTIGALDDVNFAGKTDWQILLESLEPAGIPRDDVQGRLEEYNQAVSRTLARVIGDFPVRACAGGIALVAALRQNPDVLVGLVTGNMPGLVATKLHTAGYDPADFKIGAFGSEGWQRSMLPPLALDRARAHSGITFAGEQAVIVGDTPGDITCAGSIGARTIAVATGPYSREQLAACQPDYVFDTLADTGRVLAAIFQDG